jgi:hypothetical protein
MPSRYSHDQQLAWEVDLVPGISSCEDGGHILLRDTNSMPRSREAKSLRILILAAALSLVLTAAACASSDARAHVNPSGGSTDIPEIVDVPPPNWNDPFVGSIEVATLSEAKTYLSFDPFVPTGISATPRLLVSTSGEPGATGALALVYSDSDFGRFYTIEAVSQTNQSELESLAKDCGPTPGCEAFSIVTLSNGTNALLIEGTVATSIVFLVGDVRIDVVGPSEAFTRDNAIAIANML